VHHVGRNTVYNGTQVVLLNGDNEVVMPHHVGDCAAALESNPSLLRYVDLAEAVEVLKRTTGWEHLFTTMADASNPIHIKQAYVKVMAQAPRAPPKKRYESVIRVTREDAWTVSGGAAIYMAHNVEKVGQVLLKAACIPEGVLTKLMKNIEVNTANALKLEQLRKEFENATAADAEKTNKMADERYSNPVAKQLQDQMKALVRLPVKLDDKYVPNTSAHLALWAPQSRDAFAPDVDDAMAVKIVDTRVADHWKVLLLMGVAVLTETDSGYLEIVKQLASMGKLFLVVADFTYLTGTNYQFAHGYFGKDLADLSQGMVIQALGRIGRGDLIGCTARVREPSMFQKLFGPQDTRNGLWMAQVFSYA
jgi:hypothetical protein